MVRGIFLICLSIGLFCSTLISACAKPDPKWYKSDSPLVLEELRRQDSKFPLFRTYRFTRDLYELDLTNKDNSNKRYHLNYENRTNTNASNNDVLMRIDEVNMVINKRLDIIEGRLITIENYTRYRR